jgi:hypothetical protein
MENPLESHETGEVASIGAAAIGSINVGVTELTGTNYAMDLLGSGSMGLYALAVGAGGAALAAEKLDLVNIWSEE